MTTADDPIGAIEVRLSGMSGKHDGLKLLDKNGDPVPKCTLSFSYKISADIAPAATLSIKNMKAFSIKNGKQDPYLVFKLLECGDIEQVAKTAVGVPMEGGVPIILNAHSPKGHKVKHAAHGSHQRRHRPMLAGR